MKLTYIKLLLVLALGVPWSGAHADGISGGPASSVTGRVDASNAGAGLVGESFSSFLASSGAISLTSTVGADITSIALQAGDYDCSGVVTFTTGNVIVQASYVTGVSTASATQGADGTYSVAASYPVTGALGITALTTPIIRINTATPLTVYLYANATFNISTMTGYGTLRCRRMS